MRLKETTRTAWSRGTSAHVPGGQLGTAGTKRRYGTALAGTNKHVECFRMGNIEHCTGSWAPALFQSEETGLKFNMTKQIFCQILYYILYFIMFYKYFTTEVSPVKEAFSTTFCFYKTTAFHLSDLSIH